MDGKYDASQIGLKQDTIVVKMHHESLFLPINFQSITNDVMR